MSFNETKELSIFKFLVWDYGFNLNELKFRWNVEKTLIKTWPYFYIIKSIMIIKKCIIY
jgi:hypothetical protein